MTTATQVNSSELKGKALREWQEAEILRHVSLVAMPGQVIELRIPKVDGRRNHTAAGYFDDWGALAKEGAKWSGRAAGVYITLNPVDRALLARAANRVKDWTDFATGDDDITRRLCFLIDADPERASGISSTDEEHEMALARSLAIQSWLTDQGWPQPLRADSGNGGHLVYGIDLPNDPEATLLLQRCLQAINAEWGDEVVKIDTTVYNASRISKLYGTAACKGDSTPERPHRLSRILSAPETLEPVAPSLLHELAMMAPDANEPEQTHSTRTGPTFDVEEFIQRHSATLNPSSVKMLSNGTRRWRIDCIHNPEHKGDAVIGQRTNGALWAKCSHDSCQGRWGWKELRAQLDPQPRFHANGTGPTPSTAAQEAQETPAQNANARPQILANGRQLAEIVEDALDVLKQHIATNPRWPAALQRDGELVRVLADARGVSVRTLGKDALMDLVAQAAEWIKARRTKEGTEYDNTFPPQAVINALAGRADWSGVPELKGIVNAPVYVGDGRWVQTPGYDPDSGLYYASNIVIDDAAPTPERVKWALYIVFDELLGDFPFKDDASRAHALALFLLPFVRHIIDGPTPLHAGDAPVAGTGKGLLIKACTLAGAGGELTSLAVGHDDDEMRKRLTSLFQRGALIINLDNLAGRLNSSSLAAALTEHIWEDRVLGATATVRTPIRAIWTATANNIEPSDEIARRMVWIRMDANTERPWERTGFRHSNLLQWATKYRTELVTAAMILINNWVAKGEPKGNYVKGSYEQWAPVMGGILDAAGVSGFLANEHELFAASVNDIALWAAFVEAWAEKHRETWVNGKALMEIASHSDEATLPENAGQGILDDLLGPGNMQSRSSKLGRQLARMNGRVFGEWKIVRGSVIKGSQQWRLSYVGG